MVKLHVFSLGCYKAEEGSEQEQIGSRTSEPAPSPELMMTQTMLDRPDRFVPSDHYKPHGMKLGPSNIVLQFNRQDTSEHNLEWLNNVWAWEKIIQRMEKRENKKPIVIDSPAR